MHRLLKWEVVLPLQHLASGVLADLLRRQPASNERTTFAWTVAVGPAIARATTVRLDETTLRVTPRDARWAREIERARPAILARVQSLLGPGAVKDIHINA